MKVEIKFSGDLYEDGDSLRMVFHANDMYCKIHEADQIARARMKYGENVSDEEYQTLEKIREELYLSPDFVT